MTDHDAKDSPEPTPGEEGQDSVQTAPNYPEEPEPAAEREEGAGPGEQHPPVDTVEAHRERAAADAETPRDATQDDPPRADAAAAGADDEQSLKSGLDIPADAQVELFEFRLQICVQDGADSQTPVHTKNESAHTFPSQNTVKVASKQQYKLVFQVANTKVPFDSLLAVRVGEYVVELTKQLRKSNAFVCEGVWDTSDITPTGDGFRIQMPVRVAYLLESEKHCRETEFILQMKVYDAKDAKKAQQGGTPLDCISCKFYSNSSRMVNYPTFLRS